VIFAGLVLAMIVCAELEDVARGKPPVVTYPRRRLRPRIVTALVASTMPLLVIPLAWLYSSGGPSDSAEAVMSGLLGVPVLVILRTLHHRVAEQWGPWTATATMGLVLAVGIEAAAPWESVPLSPVPVLIAAAIEPVVEPLIVKFYKWLDSKSR
jgi:hypothetical protein